MTKSKYARWWCIVGLILKFALIVISDDISHLENRCYPIVLPACNTFNISKVHTSENMQMKMKDTIDTLLQMEKLKCAPFLKFLICSITLKPCFSLAVDLKPCYEFCSDLKEKCEPALRRRVGQNWPETLNCDGLPKYSQQRAMRTCMQPPKEEFEAAEKKMKQEYEELMKQTHGNGIAAIADNWQILQNPTTSTIDFTPTVKCSSAEVLLGYKQLAVCMKRCNANLMFSQNDKEFAEIWMLLWSVICLICTGLAVCTFAMDNKRFLFPERPMIWIAGSYLLFSLGHLMRIIFGPNLACSHSESPNASTGDKYLISRYAGHWCAVNFLILYFSSISGCMWWAVMTICFYMCTAKKWMHDALQSRSTWLHLCAWGVPLLLSVVLIVRHRIEGDELTHLCQVDGSNKFNILLFIIVPISLILCVGTLFLILTVKSSFTVCSELKQIGDVNYRRVEKLVTKITLFSLLFAIPSVCSLAINVYEFLGRDSWQSSLQTILQKPECSNATGLLPINGCNLNTQPLAAVFMLKIFMSLAAGLPSGMIVWLNCKTVFAWYRCFCNIFGRRRTKQELPLATPLPYLYVGGNSNIGTASHFNGNHLESSQRKYPTISNIGTAAL